MFFGFDEVFFDSIGGDISQLSKIYDFISLVRNKYSIQNYFIVNTKNNFPTAAGLASSASGFAALALAINELCKLNLSFKELSILARQGSGSACRSIYGGFVLWNQGQITDGSDSYAEQIIKASHWPDFRVLVVITDAGKKSMSSRIAMQTTAETSTSYAQWLIESKLRLKKMIQAVEQKDLKTVGELAEADCLQMHKSMRDSMPSINYLTSSTTAVIDAVKNLRKNGSLCYFTIDAGPNVKVLCLDNDVEKIQKQLSSVDGVKTTIICGIADGPTVERI